MIRATLSRVVIKKEVAPEPKKGLIIVPTETGLPSIGTVVAVGPGKLNAAGIRVPPECVVGDRIVYNNYGGRPVTIEGEDYIFLNEEDVYAVVT